MTPPKPVRYQNLLRLLAMLSMDQSPNYADRIEELLGQISDEELFDFLFDTSNKGKDIVTKYKLPINVGNLICILLDGQIIQRSEIQMTKVPAGTKLH